MSVWVEMSVIVRNAITGLSSRSTWACELKFISFPTDTISATSHAPRERVSWNRELRSWALNDVSHAPRERVSWNMLNSGFSMKEVCHAPRERVSWNATRWLCCGLHPTSRSTWACELKCTLETLYIISLNGHAPRERVSWNEKSNAHSKKKSVTLHVSVWVEMQNN